MPHFGYRRTQSGRRCRPVVQRDAGYPNDRRAAPSTVRTTVIERVRPGGTTADEVCDTCETAVSRTDDPNMGCAAPQADTNRGMGDHTRWLAPIPASGTGCGAGLPFRSYGFRPRPPVVAGVPAGPCPGAPVGPLRGASEPVCAHPANHRDRTRRPGIPTGRRAAEPRSAQHHLMPARAVRAAVLARRDADLAPEMRPQIRRTAEAAPLGDRIDR